MTPPLDLPDKAAIKKFIDEQSGPVGRREIARAFGIKGADRTELRRILKELVATGGVTGNIMTLEDFSVVSNLQKNLRK